MHSHSSKFLSLILEFDQAYSGPSASPRQRGGWQALGFRKCSSWILLGWKEKVVTFAIKENTVSLTLFVETTVSTWRGSNCGIDQQETQKAVWAVSGKEAEEEKRLEWKPIQSPREERESQPERGWEWLSLRNVAWFPWQSPKPGRGIYFDSSMRPIFLPPSQNVLLCFPAGDAVRARQTHTYKGLYHRTEGPKL